MSGQDDDDRTVFGQKLPPAPQATDPALKGHAPWPQPPYGAPAREGAGDDGERTLFGTPPHSAGAGAAAPQPYYPPQPPYGQAAGQGRAGPPASADDTWLGGKLPPASPQSATPQSATPPSGWGQPAQPADGNTWFQGRPPAPQPSGVHAAAPHMPTPYPPAYAPPRPPMGPPIAAPQYSPYAPPAPAGYPPPYHAPPPPAAHQEWQHGVSQGQFPHVPAQAEQPARTAPVPRISFHDALRGSGIDIGTSSNPILAAATGLLVLFGRLRTGMVEMQAIPLRDHVIREIGAFVKKAQEKGTPPEDIEIARYALAATADDIVQTIPGSDPGYWQQYSMAAELLNDRSAGIGFFARLDQVIAYPSQRRHVLELMLVCLCLGFEGKYRTEPNGLAMLARLRNEVYQRLRSVEARPEPELSLNWLPVVLSGKRSGGSVPLWLIAAVGGGTVVALFAALSWILSTDTQAAQAAILSLNDPRATVAIESSAIQSREPYVVEGQNTQLERIETALAPEIERGEVQVGEKGDYIMVRVGDVLRFGSGSADLTSDFTGLAAKIAQSLDGEPGQIIVEGHSDSVPMRGTGRYRTNEQLSEARAATVRDILSQSLSDADRVSVVGVGPNDPVDTSGTREAQARNRRVEILLQQENRL